MSDFVAPEAALAPAPQAEAKAATAGYGKWLMLALLFSFALLGNIDQRLMMLLVEPIKADLKLTDFQMSLLLGPAFAISFALFGIPLGWAADRWPRKIVIWGGVTFWSLATAACGLARSFPGLFITRAAVGSGEASLNPASYSLIMARFPANRRSLALAAFSFAQKLGYSVSLLVGGAVIAMAGHVADAGVPLIGGMRPWQICFLLVGLPGVLLALLALMMPEPARPAAKAQASEALWPYLRANAVTILSLAAGFGLVAFAAGIFLPWVPTYMSREFGYSAAQTGVAVGLASLVAVGALIVKAVVTDWLFARGHKDIYVRLYIWITVASLPLVVLAFTSTNPTMFLALFSVIQMAGLAFPMFQALTSQAIAPPRLRGRMAALFLIITQIMFGLGPMLPAALSDAWGPGKLGLAMATSGGASLVGALALLLIGLRGVKPLIAHASTLETAETGVNAIGR